MHDLVLLRHAVAGVELFDADDGRNGNTVRDSRIAENELGVHVFSGSDNSRIAGNEITGNLGEAVLLANSRTARWSRATRSTASRSTRTSTPTAAS